MAATVVPRPVPVRQSQWEIWVDRFKMKDKYNTVSGPDLPDPRS